MLREGTRREIGKFRKIGALRFSLVKKPCKAARQAGSLRETQRAVALRLIPAPHQRGEKKAAADRRNRRWKIDVIRRRIKEKFVFVHVAQWAHVRQQRRAAKYTREDFGKIARRAPCRQIDRSARQRQRIAVRLQPVDQTARQRLGKWRARWNRKDIRCHLGRRKIGKRRFG